METINEGNCISEQCSMCQVTKPVNTRGVLMERLIPSYYSGLSVAQDNNLLRVFQWFWMCNLHTSPLSRKLAQCWTIPLRKESQKPPLGLLGERLSPVGVGRLRLCRQRRSSKWAGESWDQPVPTCLDETQMHRMGHSENESKKAGKGETHSANPSVKPVALESKPRCQEMQWDNQKQGGMCLLEAGKDLDYWRGGDWLSPNPGFIFSPKNSSRNPHGPQQGKTLGQSHHTRFPYSLLSQEGVTLWSKGFLLPPTRPRRTTTSDGSARATSKWRRTPYEPSNTRELLDTRTPQILTWLRPRPRASHNLRDPAQS